MRKLTDNEVADLLKSERPWNIARRVFEKHTAIISKLIDECECETSMECARYSILIRRAEFEAVAEIGRALGVLVTDLGSRETERATGLPDPAGLRNWLGPAETGPVGTGPGGGSEEGPGSGVPARPESLP